ncbi:cation:dicarboxylase symporter family transporter [Marinifilum sp. N1E240]|uniref:dicarboxylate/amino acid:cation symporter n=1 Tax=Marinifilum sp. N1E240 TaxID=2608082 RepID=UPI00128D1651|nr:dicarboxylate/amino acid:cation symporter [Marinifilum sp. N1E240]MPQ48316.1 cation:dicarboxylase symporter family transporter [Marinifilum sp. N1E240]
MFFKNILPHKNSSSSNTLLFSIIIAILGGFLVGGFLPNIAIKFSIFGEIFLNILMMLVVPMVILSMLVGISKLDDLRNLGSIGSKTLLYYMLTTGISVCIGILLVNLIQPGSHINIPLPDDGLNVISKNIQISETLKELIVGNPENEQQGIVAYNLFLAMAKMDILPLIMFSLFFGAALASLGKKAKRTIEFISVLNDGIMKLVNWVMYLAPIGIFGLITARIGKAGGYEGFLPELLSLGKFSLTVLLGLSIHALVILCIALKIFGKRNPIKYAKGVATALMNAFSTASSTATLPLTLQGVNQQNRISERTSNFVLPLGATINMDGTALYEAVAAIFIAQLYGLDLSFAQQSVIFLTATLAAIGAAGIPEAGLVTMVIVLKAVHLPIEGIGLILSIDWLLDRFRTTVNVWGDSVGAAIIENYTKKKATSD